MLNENENINLIESLFDLDCKLTAKKQRQSEIKNFCKNNIQPISDQDIDLVNFVLSNQSPETFFEDQIIDMDWNPIKSIWEAVC